MSDDVHVVPVNDLIEHEDGDDCPCGPAMIPVEREDGSIGWVVSHFSLDGRERFEGQALGWVRRFARRLALRRSAK